MAKRRDHGTTARSVASAAEDPLQPFECGARNRRAGTDHPCGRRRRRARQVSTDLASVPPPGRDQARQWPSVAPPRWRDYQSGVFTGRERREFPACPGLRRPVPVMREQRIGACSRCGGSAWMSRPERRPRLAFPDSGQRGYACSESRQADPDPAATRRQTGRFRRTTG